MFPLVKIHGGGYKNKGFVISHFPSDYTAIRYLETCVGGGSIIGNKKQSEHEIICDADPRLISIYENTKHNLKWLQNSLSLLEHSAETFYNAQCDIYSEPINEFVLRRMSRSGMMKDYAFSPRLRRGLPENQSSWESSIKSLTGWNERLQNIPIFNYDILESLMCLCADFIYLDPPFLPETRVSPAVYRHEMTFAQHEEMLKILVKEKRMVLLAGYASELYRDYLELNGFSRHDKEFANDSSQKKKKSTKILSLWKNYA